MSFVEQALKKMQAAARGGGDEAGPRAMPTGPVAALGRAPETSIAAVGQRRAAAGGGRILNINRGNLRAAGLIPPESQERQLAQQYRQIKRPLIANAIGRGTPRLDRGQLIMVASALPGEGKSFTSLNLALSIAMDKDVRVLLIDADVAKPRISSLLSIDGERGLLDALREPAVELDDLVVPTDIPGLSVLPSGRRSEQATELLASARMVEVLQGLIQRDPNLIVVLDSPPLLLTTESQALAQVAGQILVVVRADATSHREVLDALSYLASRPCVSLVLNQSVSAAMAGYYYHGYGTPPESSSGS